MDVQPTPAADTLPTCYRHGDRETRLSCSNCERPVCVDCVRSAPVGQKCPECAAPTPGARVITAREIGGAAGLRSSAPVTFGLIAACAVLFLAASALPQVVALGAQVNALVARGEWWRIATAAFLHVGLLHALFNLYALYTFGPQIERRVGSLPFAALYLGSAMAGGAAYYLFDALAGTGPGTGIAVGASGAIFGLFGAMLALAWGGRDTAVGQAGLRQLLTLLAINLALPLLVPRVAWQAHVGGLVAGVAIMATWNLIGRGAGRGSRGAARGAGARTLVGAVVGGLAVLAVSLV